MTSISEAPPCCAWSVWRAVLPPRLGLSKSHVGRMYRRFHVTDGVHALQTAYVVINAVRQVGRANLVMSHSRKAIHPDQTQKDTVPQSALQAMICTSDPKMLGLCRHCSSSALRCRSKVTSESADAGQTVPRSKGKLAFKLRDICSSFLILCR